MWQWITVVIAFEIIPKNLENRLSELKMRGGIETIQISEGFWRSKKTSFHSNSIKKNTWLSWRENHTIIIIIICRIVDFADPADPRINQKESEKNDKYPDLARELKKLWNMKVTIVPIVIGALGTITRGLFKGLEDLEVGGRVEIIQTTALLRTARILRRVLETWGDLLSLKFQWKTISWHWREKI